MVNLTDIRLVRQFIEKCIKVVNVVEFVTKLKAATDVHRVNKLFPETECENQTVVIHSKRIHFIQNLVVALETQILWRYQTKHIVYSLVSYHALLLKFLLLDRVILVGIKFMRKS